MKEMTKYSRVAGYFEKLFDRLNAHFFDGLLPKPIITIQATSRAYAHYSIFPIWKAGEEQRHEINIGAGTLDRPLEETIASLLHECCHCYANEVLNVQDVSSNCQYHNRQFKEIAESHGLNVYKSTRYGWSTTEPGDALLDWMLENPDLKEIKINRTDPAGAKVGGGSKAGSGGADAPTRKPSSTRRYICPCCRQTIRATKVVNIICGDCLEIMVPG